MSRSEVAASYRLYAAYCFDAARVMSDPGRRLALLNMAQAWTDLADHTQKSGGEGNLAEAGTPLRAQLARTSFSDLPKSRRHGWGRHG
jgi:hypothetical protein